MGHGAHRACIRAIGSASSWTNSTKGSRRVPTRSKRGRTRGPRCPSARARIWTRVDLGVVSWPKTPRIGSTRSGGFARTPSPTRLARSWTAFVASPVDTKRAWPRCSTGSQRSARIPTAEGGAASYHPRVRAQRARCAREVASFRAAEEGRTRAPSLGAAVPAWTRARRKTVRLAALRCVFVLLALLLPRMARAADPRFEVVSSEVPTTLPVGQEIHIRVVVRNIGSEPWDPATRDHLSYHLDDPASGETLIWDGRRSELPRRVEPGEEVTLD